MDSRQLCVPVLRGVHASTSPIPCIRDDTLCDNVKHRPRIGVKEASGCNVQWVELC